ncbi:IclR family transcriptional regulator [Kocuria sp. CPCC 205263]|uniref:IclR family transcriptional regulator n=1 Tax=Kocuria sp. CPCC 205263 TaxID=3073555 RepID=UPI0034D6A20D
MQNKPELPPYAIESVSNALRLLLMLRDRDSLRVTDAAAELGVARSTAHRLLMTLAHEGFVQQERNSRAYRPGPQLLEFALSSASIPELRQVAHPLLETLCAALEETVNLMALEGPSVRFVDSVECDRPVRVSGRTGALLPVHATAGGKVLLAAADPAAAQALLEAGLPRMTGRTTTSPRILREELADIRRSGYALNLGESLDGLHAAAVPVTDAAGRALAALAVSVPADRGGLSGLRRHVPALQETAGQISGLL